MELAYEKIMEKILSGQLLPGTPLREEHLAEEFGLSATPVREAFRRLEYEGWVQSRPYQGSFIRRFSPEDVDELFQLREMLEGMAAASAARNGTPEELENIRLALEAEKQYLPGSDKIFPPGNSSSTFYADLDFHSAIAAASHNQLLQPRLKMLKKQLTLAFVQNSSRTVPLTEQQRVYEEHAMICSAICRRWDDIAELLMRRHISDARKKRRPTHSE